MFDWSEWTPASVITVMIMLFVLGLLIGIVVGTSWKPVL